MFKIGAGSGNSSKGGTMVKPTKSHGSEKRMTLSKHTKRTLGSGNMREAVILPPQEDKNEWIAANTVDFFNELSLLYGLVTEQAAQKYTSPGEGFPPGFEYRWQAPGTDAKPLKCSSPEYVDYVMTWVDDQINNEDIFPISENQAFPANFVQYARDIFKRLFRIFAIIYHRHFAAIEEMDAAAHLNTCFKHFAFFCFEFDLLDEKEVKALQAPVDRMRDEFDAYTA